MAGGGALTAVLATLILWVQALAALLFGAVALTVARGPAPRRALATALGASALAAVAVAALGADDLGSGVAEALREAAWVVAILALLRRHKAGQGAFVAVGISLVAALLSALAVDLVAGLPGMAGAAGALFAAAAALRMVAFAGGLLLVHNAAELARARSDTCASAGLGGLALLWAAELAAAAAAWWLGGWAPALVAARAVALLGTAALIGAAVVGGREAPMMPSRALVWRLIAVAGLVAYTAAVVVASGYAAAWSGAQARMAQTAVVIGGGAALLVLVSTPLLRAWARVKLAKHLFDHRYDYRLEWQRFTAALAGDDPLGERIGRAVAGFTDSPAALLLTVTPDGLEREAAWNWPAPPSVEGPALATLLAGGWVVELDRVRDGSAQDGERDAVPADLAACNEAWAVVPLIHQDALVAAAVLARPPVDRRLDWEDFDLLRVAGRQAASHLAEERARGALTEARRFDEFHRRFAFIMHDLKNLVSQMTLTASNARRHADNPAFRADMVATLGDCAERMTALIARLSSHGDQPPESIGPVDALAAARRVAARFPHHPVEVAGPAPLVLAHAQRLEQLLGHLVQNAVEASASGAPVRLSLAEDDGRAVVAIADRGVGMSAGFIRDQLFRPFASSKPGGFGLGAFEARQLVAAMGGTLSVESREGEGTRFCITLPLARSAASALEISA